MKLEEGDVVLCTVDRIVGTVVFVKIHSFFSEKTEKEGSIVLSEIAPGRIRNLRDYVVPKKKIVCKVLRISGDHIELSLRRVNQKERKEVMERYKQEKSLRNIFTSIIGEETEKIIDKLTQEESLYDFLERAKEDPEILKSLVGKEKAEKILDILKSQKQKKAVIKKEIVLKSYSPNGLEIIKNILGKIKKSTGAEIRYVSAGRYSLKTEAEDIKSADKNLKEIFLEIEKESKAAGAEFGIK